MKILILAKPSYTGVSWYRYQQFAYHANRMGLADVKYMDFDLSDEEFDAVMEKADVIVTRLTPKLDYLLDTYKTPFVVDLDDSLDHVDPLSDTYRAMGVREVTLGDGSYLWKDGEGGFDISKNRKFISDIKKALGRVHGVTTTTVLLKQYIDHFNKNTVIIPNAIDFDLFAEVSDLSKKEVRMVWSGGSTHYADLAHVAPSIKNLMERYENLHFYMLGVVFKGILKDFPKDRVHTGGWIQADGHGFRLSCIDGDIGICPINDTSFNRMKSSVKFYEYSACGMATIAPALPPYSDDIADGVNGLLYSDLSEFEDKVGLLIKDSLKRAEIASHALKYIKENRDVTQITKDWVDYLVAVANESRNNNS